MSSITTAIPTGPISYGPNWCIQNMIDIFGTDEYPYEYNECANTTKGMKKSDFQTVCCDGDIIDTSQNLWSTKPRNMSEYQLDLENLVCCRKGGQLLPGGIMPIWTDWSQCEPSEKPTPLASLAATNTENAALYLLTYESASGDSTGGWADWTRTATPSCLWIETAQADVTMVDVTVPAAKITTLPPPTTDRWGYTITPSSGLDSSSTTIPPTITRQAPSKSVAAAASTAKSSIRMSRATMMTSFSLVLALITFHAL